MTNRQLQKVAVIVSLMFLPTPLFKLTDFFLAVQFVTKWGIPLWMMHFIGASELAGAIGLLVPAHKAGGGIRAVSADDRRPRDPPHARRIFLRGDAHHLRRRPVSHPGGFIAAVLSAGAGASQGVTWFLRAG